ncbi:MAG: hypothetical protein JWN70_3451 [Planctomycetaceae bacterium]|nr:hypothetical protein [Planctomycetaceae bacterium]
MTLREQVLEQVLALPLTDQAFVARAVSNHLIRHLPPETEESESDEAALLSELRRRSASYRAGTTTARDAAEVMADLRNRQSSEPMK